MSAASPLSRSMIFTISSIADASLVCGRRSDYFFFAQVFARIMPMMHIVVSKVVTKIMILFQISQVSMRLLHINTKNV